MGQTGAEKVTFMIDENLGFVFQGTKSGRVNNPVSVSLKTGSSCAVRLVKQASAALFWMTGINIGFHGPETTVTEPGKQLPEDPLTNGNS